MGVLLTIVGIAVMFFVLGLPVAVVVGIVQGLTRGRNKGG